MAEIEKELERQRLLELERAKTRELRHNLDMEKERQTQVITLENRNHYSELCYNTDFQQLFKLLI